MFRSTPKSKACNFPKGTIFYNQYGFDPKYNPSQASDTSWKSVSDNENKHYIIRERSVEDTRSLVFFETESRAVTASLKERSFPGLLLNRGKHMLSFVACALFLASISLVWKHRSLIFFKSLFKNFTSFASSFPPFQFFFTLKYIKHCVKSNNKPPLFSPNKSLPSFSSHTIM